MKQKIDIQTKLKSQLAKYPKVGPEENSISKFSGNEINEIFLLRKRLEKIETSLINRDRKLQELINSKLFPAYLKTLDSYSNLWASLSNVFTGILAIINNASTKQNGTNIMPVALSKQLEEHNFSCAHLSEWLDHAQHCVYSWGDFVKSERLHSCYLYNWVSSRNSEVFNH